MLLCLFFYLVNPVILSKTNVNFRHDYTISKY
jgi:hypothetical protein